MTKQWITNTGVQPVDDDVMVEVDFGGRVSEVKCQAGDWNWGLTKNTCPIKSYRIIEEPKQEWINGIPPVGEECEWSDERVIYWRPVTYVGANSAGEKHCLEQPDGILIIRSKCQFRPIKSPQDTEREEAIRHIEAVIYDEECREDAAEALYDAGYHNGPKVKELSDEEIYYKFARTCPSIDEDYITGARWARDYILGKDK